MIHHRVIAMPIAEGITLKIKQSVHFNKDGLILFVSNQKLVRCHKVSGIALTMCCKSKVRRLFSSLSREMLTFSRLIQHNIYLLLVNINTLNFVCISILVGVLCSVMNIIK